MDSADTTPVIPDQTESDTGRVEMLLDQLPHRDAIPRKSGEVAFEAPWELRALALGVAVHEAGNRPWADMQGALIQSIKTWEADSQEQSWQYYERWVDALETLLVQRGVMTIAELDERTKVLLATPRDGSHQHVHHDPVAVDHGRPSPQQGTEPARS